MTDVLYKILSDKHMYKPLSAKAIKLFGNFIKESKDPYRDYYPFLANPTNLKDYFLNCYHEDLIFVNEENSESADPDGLPVPLPKREQHRHSVLGFIPRNIFNEKI